MNKERDLKDFGEMKEIKTDRNFNKYLAKKSPRSPVNYGLDTFNVSITDQLGEGEAN